MTKAATVDGLAALEKRLQEDVLRFMDEPGGGDLTASLAAVTSVTIQMLAAMAETMDVPLGHMLFIHIDALHKGLDLHQSRAGAAMH